MLRSLDKIKTFNDPEYINIPVRQRIAMNYIDDFREEEFYAMADLIGEWGGVSSFLTSVLIFRFHRNNSKSKKPHLLRHGFIKLCFFITFSQSSEQPLQS